MRFLGRRLKGDVFLAFATTLRDAISERLAPVDFVESARYLVGSKLTLEALDLLCWRVAANEDVLRRGAPVLPWRQQAYKEWVPVQITGVRWRLSGRFGTERGADVEFRILAGTPCGMTMRQWWSMRKFYHMARFKDEEKLSFRFSRPPRDTSDILPPHLFQHPRQFVTLRCMALIDPELSSAEGPDFHTIAFTPALADWNALQQRFRARLSAKYECPMGYLREVKCYQCPVGLDTCRAATHDATYVEKTCPQCAQVMYFNPDDKIHAICVDCVERQTLTPDPGDR